MYIKKRIKSFIAIIILTVLLIEIIPEDILLANEELRGKIVENEVIDIAENEAVEEKFEDNIGNLEYSNQTTDEVLKLIEEGIDIEKFLQPELVNGITKEDLQEWKAQGMDITDIVSERANSESDIVTYVDAEDNNVFDIRRTTLAKATATNGKYYLTECSNPEDKGNVNLSGTGYYNELYNPKTNSRGESTPWYISIGGDTAMCVTYEGNASISTAHSYVQADINKLKNNKYFAGGVDYPIEGYLRGVCFAYEKLMDAGSNNDFYVSGSIDVNLLELIRESGSSELVARAGKSINYAVLQIITWRIACGKFNPDNMAYESKLAKVIFEQMYPIEDWGDTYYKSIEAFYDYYAKCAKESATGRYDYTYGKTKVIYWEVQGANTDNWQDFITWNVGTPKIKQIKVSKYGKNTESIEKNAIYGIYSDNRCTNKLGEFTTNSNGYFTISAVEGTYYLKELKAPVGTVISKDIIELIIEDDTLEISVENEEMYNNLEIYKYEYATCEKVIPEAKYALYEYDGRSKSYLRMGQLHYDDNGKYSMNKLELYTYHCADGSKKELNTARLYYTPNNQGKFMIREEESPIGFSKGEDRYFSMIMVNGAIISFNTYETGMVEIPNYASVMLKKNDYFTGTELSGAGFLIQEKIEGKWYDVGELLEDRLEKNVSNNTYNIEGVSYITSKKCEYNFHNKSGEVIDTITNSDYPLHYTTYNNGQYRIIETKSPDSRYVGGWNKAFTVKPKENNYNYQFTTYGVNSATNYGKSVKVKTLKYDETTGEVVENEDTSAVITIYEYISAINEWKEVGILQYSKEEKEYVMNELMQYKIHNEKGDEVKTSVNGIYLPGFIYYTSANQGQFKIVETAAPVNYENGKYNYETENIVVYEEKFNISAQNTDKDVIDLTAFENAAVDTGVSTDIELVKYDSITMEIIKENDAVFKVYEYIQKSDIWLEVGILKYNEEKGVYTSRGMEVQYHNSKGNNAGDKEICTRGLKYTNANWGKYKIVEVNPPTFYCNSKYEKEFNVTEVEDNDRIIRFEDYSNAAFDLGIKGYTEVIKYDAMTYEKADSNDAVFGIYEKINERWLKVGELKYDEEIEYYSTKGVEYEFHNSNGNIIDSSVIVGFEKGVLYYTTANKGRYKVVEEKAPENYCLQNFEREFQITDNGQTFSYSTIEDGAKDIGISGVVKVAKYDSVTKERVISKDAEFTVYEYNHILDEWLALGILIYDSENDEYVSDGAEFIFHGEEGEVLGVDEINDYEKGRLYYTTSNQGKFKLIETKAPSNYELDGYVKEFSVSESNEEIDYTTIDSGFYNKGISGMVKLAKEDKVTEQPLTGAVFALKEWSQTNNDWLIKNNLQDIGDGIYVTEELVYTTQNQGKFKIEEIKAPEGYLNDNYESMELLLSDSQRYFDLTTTGKATDTPIRVSISKKSIATGKDILGAKLRVKNSDGSIIDEWISDGKEHIISGIKEGKYVLEEEFAPEGYIISNSVQFQVNSSYEIQKVEMFDEVVKGKIIIDKIDKNTGEKLSGAIFELWEVEGEKRKFIQRLVTDNKGIAESDELLFGIYDDNGKYIGSKEYILKEIQAPDGYKANSDDITITFDYVDYNTKIVEVKKTISNEKEPNIPTGDNVHWKWLVIIIFVAGTIIINKVIRKCEAN